MDTGPGSRGVHLRGTGDGDAFERWYEAYHTRLRGWCLSMLKDPAAAEDVAQETLLRAWTRRDRFAADADIAPWLFRVARNLCIDQIRSRRHLTPVPDLPETADEGPDPESSVLREERRRQVRLALEGLSPRHRELLMSREVAEEPYEDMAGRLGLTLEGTRAALFRARRSLRDALIAGGGLGVAAWPFRRFGDMLKRRIGPRLSPQVAGLEMAAAAMVALTALGPQPGAPSRPAVPGGRPEVAVTATAAPEVLPMPADGSPDAALRPADPATTPGFPSAAGASTSAPKRGWNTSVKVGGSDDAPGSETADVSVDVIWGSPEDPGDGSDPLSEAPDVTAELLRHRPGSP